MQHNLGRLIDGCLARCASAGNLNPSAAAEEINNAIQEIYNIMRTRRSEWLKRVAYLDIASGIDLYRLPDDVGDIAYVQRLTATGVPYKLQRYDSELFDNRNLAFNPPEIWAQIGRSIRIAPIPTEAVNEGLRISYERKPVRLIDDEDVPDLPDELHETVIALALMRLAQHAEIAIPNPDAVVGFARQQIELLQNWLVPRHREPVSIRDEDPDYMAPW